MVYSNLLYLLVVIFALSTSSIPDEPRLLPLQAALIFIIKAVLFVGLVRHVHNKGIRRSADYFSYEMRFSILAIVSVAADIYLLDCKYYFSLLPLSKDLPTIIDLCGMSLFLGYLMVMWSASLHNYRRVFGGYQRRKTFVLSNLKINFSIILPWLLVSFFSDLLGLTPLTPIKGFLDSPWGEPLLIIVFFLLLAVWFPVLLTRLWGCMSMPDGPVRERIEAFCREQNIGFADIMLWPLFEGKMITAGVMGLVKKFRYLLITPALLNNTEGDELEAVLAHELGHVKLYHLQLYVLLFLGFGALAQLSAQPFLLLLMSTNLFYGVMQFSDKEPQEILAFLSSAPIFLFMIVYFRYVFGFFMRNFERQADLQALASLGKASPLIRVLEKIAILSGNIRDLPSWHHFGIGQRVDFLVAAERDRKVIRRHHQKVYLALLVYTMVIVGGVLVYVSMPPDFFGNAPKEQYSDAVTARMIARKIKEEPNNPLWYQFMGGLQQGRKSYEEAVNAYEQSLALMPDNPEVLNELAWLLLTAKERRFRDPVRALELAKEAVRIQPRGFILDTLAEAYWFNGMIQEAVAAEQRAIQLDRANKGYYMKQIKKFTARRW